jgi:hypothetical protein
VVVGPTGEAVRWKHVSEGLHTHAFHARSFTYSDIAHVKISNLRIVCIRLSTSALTA